MTNLMYMHTEIKNLYIPYILAKFYKLLILNFFKLYIKILD